MSDLQSKQSISFTIMYIYNAATVVIAARMLPGSLNESSTATLERIWQRARLILRGYEAYGNNTSRMLLVLEQLYERVDELCQGQERTRSVFASSGEQSDAEGPSEESTVGSSSRPFIPVMEDITSSATSPDVDEVFSNINAMELNFDWNDSSWLQYGGPGMDETQPHP